MHISKDFIKLKGCHILTLSLLMAEVIYCLESKIKVFSEFNVVVANVFEDFSWKKFSFVVILIVNTSLTRSIKI